MKILKLLIIFFIIASIFFGISVYWRIIRIPIYDSYENQKAYAHKRYMHIYNTPTARIKIAWDWVLDAFDIVYKKFPDKAYDDIDTLGWTGDAYFFSNRYDDALKYYTKELDVFKATKLAPDYTKLGYNTQRIQNITSLNYKWLFKIYNLVSNCYYGKSEYDKSEATLREFINLADEPTKSLEIWQRYNLIGEAWKGIAGIYKRKKEYNKAIEIYDNLEKEFPKVSIQVGLQEAKARTYIQMGDVKKAKQIYEELINKYGKNSVYAINAMNALKQLQHEN